MGKIDDFYINFDDHWAVYRPGQKVTGRAVLKLNGELGWCEKIYALFSGSARVLWMENDIPGNAHSSESIFFDQKSLIWPANPKKENIVQKSIKLTPGRHEFQFSYNLPFEIPTSFEAQYSPGRIRYSVKICLADCQDNIRVSRKSVFCVVKPLDLNSINQSLLDQPYENSFVRNLSNSPYQKYYTKMKLFSPKTMGNKCSSTLQVKISTPKTGYVPGERIEMEIRLKNDSPFLTVKKTKLHLNQIVTCFSDKPDYKMKEIYKKLGSCTDDTKVGLKSKKIEHVCKFSNLYVPAVVPNFCLDAVLDVRYALKVELTIGADMVIFCTEIPLTIGTVPLIGKTRYFSENWNTRTEAPPAYDNFAMNIPPPTYEETLAGFCRVDSCTGFHINAAWLANFILPK
uniref:Arrestin C-terminal-like domain-containing protein n=1 Tax=Romanomermis culicivorax TaxID=13658 RepID=A0A915JS97_ROMCU